jgi:hypothetical protein
VALGCKTWFFEETPFCVHQGKITHQKLANQNTMKTPKVIPGTTKQRLNYLKYFQAGT